MKYFFKILFWHSAWQWRSVAAVAEKSPRENKDKKKQGLRAVSTEFAIDFSRGDYYKSRK